MSAVAGGPVGRRLARGGIWGAAPVLVLLAVAMLAGGVLEKQHCRAQGWSSPDQFWHACYSDIPVLYGSARLGDPDAPTLTEAVSPAGLGQPPLASAAMWVVSRFAGGSGSGSALRFFDLSTLVLAVLLVSGVVMLAAALRTRRWDAAHLALSPLLLTAALVSYQLLAVALIAGVALAISRGRAVLAGVLLGLGVAAAPQVAVLGAAVLLLAPWRRGSAGAGADAAGAADGSAGPRGADQRAAGLRAAGLPDAIALAGTAALVWAATRVVLFSGLGGGIREAWEGWRGAGPGYGSIWLVPQLLAESRPRQARWWFSASLEPGLTTTLSVLALLAVLAVGVWVSRAGRPGFAPLALMLMAGVLLANTSLPVQASLLLLPLIAASGLAWRDHLVWAVAELAYFVGIWLYIAGQTTPERGLPANFYLVLVLVRLGAIAWIGIQAGRLALPGDDRSPDGDLWTGFRDRGPARVASPGQTR